MFVETSLKPFDKLQSNLSKHVDNVRHIAKQFWKFHLVAFNNKGHGSYRLCAKAEDTLAE